MKDYDPTLGFDAESAKRHDVRGDEEAAVAFLERLARGGPVLELAIGTGRIALPLAERGIRVDGIDISPAMLDRLRAKPGGDRLTVVLGDFAEVDLPDRYALVFVVWNTLFNIPTQEAQVRCFENVAAHLTEGGAFVVEAFVPTFLFGERPEQRVDVESIEADSVRIGLLKHEVAEQRIEQSHVSISSAGIRTTPVVQRYAWPSEIDLMARLAGLRLEDRFAGWNGEPFTSRSDLHVSVYRR